MTFSQPHFRRPFFLNARYCWNMDTKTIGDTFHYFVYTLTKGCRTAADADPGFLRNILDLGTKESMEHGHMDSEDYLLQISL